MKKSFLYVLLILSIFISPAYAKSKYSKEFIKHFAQCRPYKEMSYNVSYNSNDTYEIKGYSKDGSGRCVYEETNIWGRGTFVTTCKFLPPQHEEYFSSMLNPDAKTTVFIKGMAFVNANEKAVYLKYYNMPSVCTTKTK